MATAWDEKDDAELMALIKDGSHHAFGVLVERHTTRFYSLSYRYLNSRAEAEDIVQEAFLKLWESPDSWQQTRNVKFTTWFYRVIVNLCLDKLKKKTAKPIKEGVDYADSRPTPYEELEATESEKLLEKHIQDLPERQQTALNLCFYEGLSNQEAAEVMNMNLKALQSLLMRAKETLKAKMQIYSREDYDRKRKNG